MTTTIPTAETWADVQERLDAAAAQDYAAVQRELEAAETEHRRLTEQALMGALGAVGPLDLQRVESRKQLAELQLKGLPEKHRVAGNDARAAYAATVRARALEVLDRHRGSGDRVSAAQAKLAEALRELRELADAWNGDVAAVLADARPAFIRFARREALVEMQPYLDETTQTVQERPVVKRPAEIVQERAWEVAEALGMDPRLRGDKLTTLVVDGQEVGPVEVEFLVLEVVAESLPRNLQEPVRRALRPLGRLGQ